jgi:DNA-binding LacI/PurR family transcriptional regulator
VTASNLVDGVILLDVKRDDDRLVALSAARQPGVLVGMPEESVAFDAVDVDFAAAGSGLVDHLWDRGHRDVIFLTLPDRIFELGLGYAWRFHDAVTRRARELGMSLRIVVGDADPTRRAAAIADGLDRFPTSTALLVHNDGALADLQQLLRSRSVDVPADLSVVSLYPEQFGRMFSLPYTAIETSAATVAAEAVNLLARRIEDPEAPVVRRLLPAVIIDRGSSAQR